MQLTPEQVGILFTVVTGLLIALTNYLTSQSTKKKVAELHTKVNTLHATVVGQQPPGPLTPTLVDGHTGLRIRNEGSATTTGNPVTWETPAKPKA